MSSTSVSGACRKKIDTLIEKMDTIITLLTGSQKQMISEKQFPLLPKFVLNNQNELLDFDNLLKNNKEAAEQFASSSELPLFHLFFVFNVILFSESNNFSLRKRHCQKNSGKYYGQDNFQRIS